MTLKPHNHFNPSAFVVFPFSQTPPLFTHTLTNMHRPSSLKAKPALSDTHAQNNTLINCTQPTHPPTPPLAAPPNTHTRNQMIYKNKELDLDSWKRGGEREKGETREKHWSVQLMKSNEQPGGTARTKSKKKSINQFLWSARENQRGYGRGQESEKEKHRNNT